MNDRIQRFEHAADLVNDPVFVAAAERIGRNAAEHVFLRIGVDTTGGSGVLEGQALFAFIRDLKKSRPMEERRIQDLEARMDRHEAVCAANQGTLLERLNKQDAALRTIARQTMMVLLAIISGLAAIVGYFLVTHGLPGAK